MIKINLKEFPLHLPYTDNKQALNKYIKLNNQSIYNGKINRFSRAILIKNLHNYVIKEISNISPIKKYPISVHYTIKTVVNHGDVSRRKGKIIWKYPSVDYEPRWDIENLASLWIKGGNDSLVLSGILKDDSVQYINRISYEFIPIKELEDREIIITIKN